MRAIALPSFALALGAFVAGVACAPGTRIDQGRPKTTRAHAHTSDERPFSATCPADAPWNGEACVGQGYVTCPGGSHLEDAGCVRPDDAGVAAAPPPKRPPKDAEVDEPPDLASDDETKPPDTGVPECDELLEKLRHCFPESAYEPMRQAMKQLVKQVGRQVAAQGCVVQGPQLPAVCP
jgi:hypothetical protein